MKNIKQFHWLWVTLLVLVLDLATKKLATIYILTLLPYKVTPFLNFRLVYNTGSAFGFLDQQSGWQLWFLSIVAIIICIILLVWLYRLPSSHRWSAAAIAMIIGGALGNMFDRITLGYVLDFIDFHIKSYHWPAFNIADMAICIGVIILLIRWIFHR